MAGRLSFYYTVTAGAGTSEPKLDPSFGGGEGIVRFEPGTAKGVVTDSSDNLYVTGSASGLPDASMATMSPPLSESQTITKQA